MTAIRSSMVSGAERLSFSSQSVRIHSMEEESEEQAVSGRP